MYICSTSVNGYLGCFHALAIVNSAAVNIGVHVSFSVMVSSGYTPSSRIVGSYGSFGEGNDNTLQYSCLGNPMDRGAWQATVNGVAKRRTHLSD